jgi:hypothetical protein
LVAQLTTTLWRIRVCPLPFDRQRAKRPKIVGRAAATDNLRGSTKEERKKVKADAESERARVLMHPSANPVMTVMLGYHHQPSAI